eukprot:10668070-Alexandrium_andersonii.AAC.1
MSPSARKLPTTSLGSALSRRATIFSNACFPCSASTSPAPTSAIDAAVSLGQKAFGGQAALAM